MKNKSEEESLHRFYVRAFPMLCVRFPWMLNSGLQFTDLGRRKCDVQFTIWLRKKPFCNSVTLSNCIYRRHSVRSGKKPSTQCHLSGKQSQWAMRSFLVRLYGNDLKICLQKETLAQSFWIALTCADLDCSISFQKNWQQQLSWRQIKTNCAVPNVF